MGIDTIYQYGATRDIWHIFLKCGKRFALYNAIRKIKHAYLGASSSVRIITLTGHTSKKHLVAEAP